MAGATVARAARQAQIHRTTIYLRLEASPAFITEFARHRTSPKP